MDVRSITPKETTDLSSELYDTGLISFKELAILSFQPDLGKISLPDGVSGYLTPADSSGRRDLIAEYEEKIEIEKKHGQKTAISERILDYLHILDAAKRKPIEIVV